MENELNKKQLLLLILIAYAFSVAVRFIWVYQFHGYVPFMFHGQFMINTNDGYYYAQGAQNLLLSPHHRWYHSPYHSALSIVTYVLTKITHLKLNTVMFYMPMYISSLIVVPVILISTLFKRLEVGFIAALLSSIAWSYYNRTMVGYYDTDMLTVVLPSFVLYGVVAAQQTNKSKYLLFSAIFVLLYSWWYHASFSLNFAFVGLYFLYTIIFDRKNVYNYKLLAIMLTAMIVASLLLKAIIIIILYIIFKNSRFDKFVYYIFGAAIAAMFMTGGFNPIMSELNGYVFRSSVSDVKDNGLNLHFFSVMQTIRESSAIPFTLFADRISGSVATFLISIVGYIWLSYRFRFMLFALPMIGLGFLAMHSGLRFTIYAIVPLALGIAYLISEIAKKMPSYFLYYSTLAVGALLILIPNLLHVKAYRVPTVFNNSEVRILNHLKEISNPKDYVISWWDYGYPLRYYAHLRTLIDGGLHSGSADYPVSYILTHPQNISAKLARLEIEYEVKDAKLAKKAALAKEHIKLFSPIEEMTTANGFKNVNNFLTALKNNHIKIPSPTRDIYLYIPYKMIEIYPTIALFSNLNVMSGQRYAMPLYFVSSVLKQEGAKIYLQEGVVLNAKNATVKFSNATAHINHFVKTWYDKDGHLHKIVKTVDPNSNVNVIFMSSYGKFLIIDNATYSSLFVQLFVLQNYNPKLFQPVELSPYSVVYKLKI